MAPTILSVDEVPDGGSSRSEGEDEHQPTILVLLTTDKEENNDDQYHQHQHQHQHQFLEVVELAVVDDWTRDTETRPNE